MLTFRETLDRAIAHNLDGWKLIAAREVSEYLENNEICVSADEFEQLSHFVYDWIIHTDANPYDVVNALVEVIQDSDYYKFSDIYTDWNELTKAVNNKF